MIIKTFKGGYDGNFSYLAIDSDQALLIDTSIPATEILEYCEKENLKLCAVVVMHSHHDHIIDLDVYRRRGIPIIGHKSLPFTIDQNVDETESVSVGRKKFTVMHTPGHRFDCICLFDGKRLFTSDTLFVGACGGVHFPGSDPGKMLETLNRLKRLPDDTIIYPGHDYGKTKTSTIKYEKQNNKFLNMTKEDFLQR